MNEPTVIRRAGEAYIGITGHVTMSTFNEIADRFPEIFTWLSARGVAPIGAPYFRYHVVDMAGEIEVEACVPVPPGSAVPATDEAVTKGSVPEGRYLTVRHHGHPAGLQQVMAELFDWAAERNLRFDREPATRGERWAARLEIYLTDPADEPDPANWETALCIKLGPDPDAAGPGAGRR